MESYVTRQQVREINRKLFANDIIYMGEDEDTVNQLIASIIQKYDPKDEMAGVPSIIELKEGNLNADTLNSVLLLDKESAFIQVNSKLLALPDKLALIKTIKESGYQIIIVINKDDTVFTLAKIFADIVKFDINAMPENIFNTRNDFNCKKLACNVNSPENYVLAEQSGMDYYEGTYISPASNVEIDKSEHSQYNFIEIIAKINDENSKIEDIGNIIARDSLMSAQVIRLANSVYFGSMYRIESISGAVVRIGLDNLKKWIFLLKFVNNPNVPEELLECSYHRAVFCERITKESNRHDISPNDAYMIGLFSTLDILTGRSMDVELSKMNLSETVEDALIYRDGVGGTLLNLIRAYEEANWTRVDKYITTFGLSKNRIYDIYYKSIDEVAKLWKSMKEHEGTKC